MGKECLESSWLMNRKGTGELPILYFGGTGGAAAAVSLPVELAEITESLFDWAGEAGRKSSGTVTEPRECTRILRGSSFSGIDLILFWRCGSEILSSLARDRFLLTLKFAIRFDFDFVTGVADSPSLFSRPSTLGRVSVLVALVQVEPVVEPRLRECRLGFLNLNSGPRARCPYLDST